MNWVVRVFCLSMPLLSGCKEGSLELSLEHPTPYTFIMFGAFGMSILTAFICMGATDSDKRAISAVIGAIFLIISLVILA